MNLLLIVLLIFLLIGGIPAYRNRGDWGPGPSGIVGLLIVVVLVIFFVRLLGYYPL